MESIPPKRIRKSGSSILLNLFIFVAVLCGIIMFYSSSGLYYGWLEYRAAREQETIRDITSPFTTALRNFMFERGRMNMALSANDPLSEEDRAFIDERRAVSDKFFGVGFSLMGGKYPEQAELLYKEYERIKVLRVEVDKALEQTKIQRDPNDRAVWFAGWTNYINYVSATLKSMDGSPGNNNLIAQYNELIVDTLRFRGIAGSELSIFISAIACGETMDENEYAALLLARGESKQVWSYIENRIELIDSDSLVKAADIVKMNYYWRFQPCLDRLLDLALKNQIYEGADRDLADLSVVALDSILLLVDKAIEGIDRENQANMQKGYKNYIKGLIQLLVGIGLIIFIPAYIKTRLIRPLDSLVELIENLSVGKIGAGAPFVQRKDEIGKLAGGVEMLRKSMQREQILKKELQQAVIKLEELSITDPLTGLYNRRFIMEKINEAEVRHKRGKHPFSIVIGDIDFFKNVNDSHGHDCGDFVLRNIAEFLAGCCREQDVLSRWGGEEFLILLPDTNQDGARVLAERARLGLENMVIQYREISVRVTMTFGLSEYSEAHGIEGTIKSADMALLRGKQTGRNRVVMR